MKRYFLCLFAMVGALCAWAQSTETTALNNTAATVANSTATAVAAAPAAAPRYGYCSLNALVQSRPEYVKAQAELKKLREKYEQEALYNETEFRRQYSEYLNGQKDFPQTILLKRQRDLQDLMEKGITFRLEADSLLKQAEVDLLQPIRTRVEGVIRTVALERGYEYVVNTDLGAYLYLDATLSEDMTLYVEQRLQK